MQQIGFGIKVFLGHVIAFDLRSLTGIWSRHGIYPAAPDQHFHLSGVGGRNDSVEHSPREYNHERDDDQSPLAEEQRDNVAQSWLGSVLLSPNQLQLLAHKVYRFVKTALAWCKGSSSKWGSSVESLRSCSAAHK